MSINRDERWLLISEARDHLDTLSKIDPVYGLISDAELYVMESVSLSALILRLKRAYRFYSTKSLNKRK